MLVAGLITLAVGILVILKAKKYGIKSLRGVLCGVIGAFLILVGGIWTTVSTEVPKKNTQINKTVQAPAPAVIKDKNATVQAPAPAVIKGKNVDDLDIHFNSTVRNDKTKNWRIATYAKSEQIQLYAQSYVNKYFKNDNEIHAVINFSLNTTAAIKKYGKILDITIHEYVKKEEHDAAKLFSGMQLAHYEVDMSNGNIKKL